jgi:hypothetical protein
MQELFHFMFIICFVVNLIGSGESYILFARMITIINSLREQAPKRAIIKDRSINVEYRFGKRIYCIMILKKPPMQWVHVAALENGEWTNKTGEMEYHAGPFKNFHGLALTPRHINPNYEKVAFRFEDNAIIHVLPDEIISRKLKQSYTAIKEAPKSNPQ